MSKSKVTKPERIYIVRLTMDDAAKIYHSIILEVIQQSARGKTKEAEEAMERAHRFMGQLTKGENNDRK